MGPAAPSPTLSHLRQTLAGLDPSLGPQLVEDRESLQFAAPIDQVLGGGLAFGGLHELAPAAPLHLGAASGFALALAAAPAGARRGRFWIRPTSPAARPARSTARGSPCSGFRCRGCWSCGCRARSMCCGRWRKRCVPGARRRRRRADGDGAEADLTATRRLSLAARDGGGARPAAAPSRLADAERGGNPLADRRRRRAGPTHYGGLGRTAFDLSLAQEPPRPLRPLDHRVGPP